MASTFGHYASVAACSFRLSLQRQLEYPLWMVSFLAAIPLHYLTGLWMLKVMVDRFQPLAGWTFPQIAFLYGLGLLSHGLQVIFFVQTWWIGGHVVAGHFDRMLLRPMNVFFQFMAQNVNLAGVIDLIPGTMIFAYGCHMVGFHWTLLNVLKLIAVLFGAMLLRAAIYTISNSFSFWTVSPGSLRGPVLELLYRGTLYPLTIYPRFFQMLLTFLLPVGFISFYPACDFLGRDAPSALPLGLAVWTPVVGVTAFAAAHALFVRGLRRYESAGS